MATVNSELVINWMKQHYGEEHSKQEIATALGISVPAVTATMNFLIKNDYAVTSRVETIVESEATETRKAKTKDVKYHMLTEAGLAYDPVAAAAEKLAKKEAEKAEKAAARAAAKAAQNA